MLLGTASFMRKMEVRMPGNIHLKTGLFLAVDHQLTAAFAVKYNASENVDYALRMMKRSRITPDGYKRQGADRSAEKRWLEPVSPALATRSLAMTPFSAMNSTVMPST